MANGVRRPNIIMEAITYLCLRGSLPRREPASHAGAVEEWPGRDVDTTIVVANVVNVVNVVIVVIVANVEVHVEFLQFFSIITNWKENRTNG